MKNWPPSLDFLGLVAFGATARFLLVGDVNSLLFASLAISIVAAGALMDRLRQRREDEIRRQLESLEGQLRDLRSSLSLRR